MPDPYSYTKSIDKRIVKAVEKVLRTKVLSASKIKLGEINHVYKIVTPTRNVVARVFRYKKWPQDGKHQWIEKQLTKLKVPHAKIIYYSRNNKFFPNGFMVSEFIEGLNGMEAIKKNVMSESRLYFEFGKIARKIHSVKLKKYGAINNGKGEFSNYTEMQLDNISEKLIELTSKKALAENPYPLVADMLNKEIAIFEKRFHPVLLHGDLSETNAIVSKDKHVILVDWDNARAGIWPAEFIELARRHLFMKGSKKNKLRAKQAQQAFFKGYAKISFTPKEVAKIEYALQIIRQIWQMHYYFFDRKDMKNFKIVKGTFYKLLSGFAKVTQKELKLAYNI